MVKDVLRLSVRLIRNRSILTLLLRLVGVSFIFLTTALLTRNFDPELIGQYDFIRSYLLVIGSVALFGTDQSILYFSGLFQQHTRKANIQVLYFRIVRLYGLITAAIFVLFFGIASLDIVPLDDDLFWLLLKANAILFFYAVSLLNTELMRALDSILMSEYFRNVFKYKPLLAGVVYCYFFGNVSLLLDFFIFGFVVYALLSSAIIFRSLRNGDGTQADHVVPSREILRKSLPITTSTIALYLLTTIDVFFIKYYFGNDEIAFYSLGVKIITIVTVLTHAICVSVAQNISHLYFNKEYDGLQALLRKSARLIAVIAVPLILAGICFSSQITQFFGTEYSRATPVLLILCIGHLFNSFFGVTSFYLNMTGRGLVFQNVLIGAVVLNIVLNLALIPVLNIEGAAIASVASLLFWNSGCAYYVYRKDGLKTFVS